MLASCLFPWVLTLREESAQNGVGGGIGFRALHVTVCCRLSQGITVTEHVDLLPMREINALFSET